jgi:hypothetical protein
MDLLRHPGAYFSRRWHFIIILPAGWEMSHDVQVALDGEVAWLLLEDATPY